MTNTKALNIAIELLRAESRKYKQAKIMYSMDHISTQQAGAKRWDEVNEAIEILQAMRQL